MFMDDTLQINPAQLSGSIENQMNLFTMEHEENYGDMMNELIGIFIPPENATHEELEEAKKNMDKYADYRTYLSFDMQQIVQGEEDMKIGLGKMIRKNSGGEGQNPKYVALLAGFAMLYMQQSNRDSKIRLVLLDEAFSKMDKERSEVCLKYARELELQLIVCVPDERLQSLIRNVDSVYGFRRFRNQVTMMHIDKGNYLDMIAGESRSEEV